MGRRNLIRDIDNLERDLDADIERYSTPGGEPGGYNSGEEVISEANSSITENQEEANLESACFATW